MHAILVLSWCRAHLLQLERDLDLWDILLDPPLQRLQINWLSDFSCHLGVIWLPSLKQVAWDTPKYLSKAAVCSPHELTFFLGQNTSAVGTES